MTECKDLARNFSLTREKCRLAATHIVEHTEGRTYPLCELHAKEQYESWLDRRLHVEMRPLVPSDFL